MAEQITDFLSAWAAAEQSGDPAAIDRFLADDFESVGPLGFTLTHKDWLDRHASGDLHYDTHEASDFQVRQYGDVAVVVVRLASTGNYRGNPLPGGTRATVVAVRAGESWQLTHVHNSFIAGMPGSPPMLGRPSSQD